ncbi:MAG: SDR family oxidoreductase [Deltaproteobacteria bacterium]|nr:SDR family oxidoreductase [Deltaproteobacteria bacterium]
MNETIFITGAGKGIGKATSLLLAKQGYGLFLCDWDESNLKQTVAECESYTKEVCSISIDLQKKESVDKAIALYQENFPSKTFRLKCLINNAGVGGWYKIEDFPVEKWDEIINVNLRGTFLVTKNVVPIFKEQAYGTVITIASDASEFGFPTRTAYCASKYGLIGFSNSLRAELREWGIRVSSIYISRVDTYFNGNIPGKVPNILKPEHVAETICFIVSRPDILEVREIKLTSIKSSYGI